MKVVYEFMRKLILAMAVLIVVGSNVRAAAPANDRLSNRIILTGSNVTVAGSNAGATKESGEPNHGGNPGGSSV